MARNLTIEWTEYSAETDEETVHQLPAKREVCGRCDGEGVHTNPNVDGHGISQEEWDNAWSPEEREGYVNGMYDVTCEVCHGAKVVEVLDRERAVQQCPELLQRYENYLQEEYEYEAMCAAERRMGA